MMTKIERSSATLIRICKAISQVSIVFCPPYLVEVRTILNCHELLLNTVSISLCAKIEIALDLHIDLHVLCGRLFGTWCYRLWQLSRTGWFT